jgi:hypothetical protein
MKLRNEAWEKKKKDFITKKMNILKEVILDAAKTEHFKE